TRLCVNRRDGIDLCTCNSVSDIFNNTISQNDMFLSKMPLQKLDNWMNSLPNNPKELIITHLREMSHIKDILPQSQLMNTLDVYTQDDFANHQILSNKVFNFLITFNNRLSDTNLK
ncbi:hypothetical protein QE152_g41082, partial [Popillia japonica]